MRRRIRNTIQKQEAHQLVGTKRNAAQQSISKSLQTFCVSLMEILHHTVTEVADHVEACSVPCICLQYSLTFSNSFPEVVSDAISGKAIEEFGLGVRVKLSVLNQTSHSWIIRRTHFVPYERTNELWGTACRKAQSHRVSLWKSTWSKIRALCEEKVFVLNCLSR